MSPRSGCLVLLALCTASVTSCSSTVVNTRWQDPAATQIRFAKVLSLCVAKDQELREAAEGELCRYMPRTQCKPAYFAIPDSMRSQVDQAKALTLKEGFDGAVVFRILGAKQRVTYVPGAYGPSFWGYYGSAWSNPYDPGSYRTDEVVVVETAIFSLKDDRMLWVGTTETLNPKSLPELVKDVAKAVHGELVRRDLLPPT